MSNQMPNICSFYMLSCNNAVQRESCHPKATTICKTILNYKYPLYYYSVFVMFMARITNETWNIPFTALLIILIENHALFYFINFVCSFLPTKFYLDYFFVVVFFHLVKNSCKHFRVGAYYF